MAKTTEKPNKTESKTKKRVSEVKTSSKHIPRKVRLAEITKLLKKDQYTVAQAAEILPKLSLSKAVSAYDLVVNIKLKQKQANESIRGSVVFPNSFGLQKRILVLAEAEKQGEAEAAGADFVGFDDMVEKVMGGWTEFDVVIATPTVMPKIARLGKVLGPKQLMPNPKTGTVTMKLADVIAEYKSGKVDFKMDAGRGIKIRFGKTDQTTDAIAANLTAALEAVQAEIRRLGPNALGSIYVKPTMGPVLKVSMN